MSRPILALALALLTKSADTRNAENVVTIGSPAVAAWFTRNWGERRSASRVFEAE